MFFVLLIFLLFSQFLDADEWNPKYYSPDFEGIRSQTRHAIKEVPKLKLLGQESVLDVGCGDGKISCYIASKWLSNGTMHGIDISSTMIDEAKKNSTENVTFSCGSLFSSPEQLYDVVTCFWVLYLFSDYANALKATLAHLKPGGKILICHIIEPGTPYFQLFKKTSGQQMPILPSLEKIFDAIKESKAEIEYLEVKYNYDKQIIQFWIIQK